jgi:hypothetical protein
MLHNAFRRLRSPWLVVSGNTAQPGWSLVQQSQCTLADLPWIELGHLISLTAA